MLRRMIQGSVVGLVSVALFGDVSSVVSAIPTALLDMKYSRDAEREADDYAIAMMQANRMHLHGLVLTFEKLSKKSPQASRYLSSHPAPSERVERIRLAEHRAPHPAPSLSVEKDGLSSVNALTGEWRPNAEAWIKTARQRGMTPEKEAVLRDHLVQDRVVFRDANRVYFALASRTRGEFAYTAKPITQGCYELEIVEWGRHLACVSGDVLLMVDLRTNVTEHYVRHSSRRQ
jgi:hypothetical protein